MSLTGSLSYKGIPLPNAFINLSTVVMQANGGVKTLQGVYRVYKDQATYQAGSNDFIFDANFPEPIPYVPGQDSVATCYTALAASGGPFAGFAPC